MRAVVLAKRNTPVMTVSSGPRGVCGLAFWGALGSRRRRRTGGYCEGAFASEEGELDHPPCEERAGDADDAQDDLLYARWVECLWWSKRVRQGALTLR